MSETSGESKISVADGTNMSLDEYIVAKGIKKAPHKQKQKPKKNQEAMDMDYDDSIPCAQSVAWRLTDVNRPVGMSPLIPTNARQKVYNNNNGGNYKYRHRYFEEPYADRDKPSNVLNGVNRKSNFKRNVRQNQNVVMQTGLRNSLTSSALVRHQSNAIETMNKISENVAGLVMPFINTSAYENVFNKLMEKWEEKKNQNKQKYDMGLQKEISEIQGKTLYFTASGSGQTTTVCTSNGNGLNDLEVRPAATDTTLHERFA